MPQQNQPSAEATSPEDVDAIDGRDDPAASPYRLPRTVLPDRYELTMEPDLPQAAFSGAVGIAVRVVEPTATVVLNAVDLDIDEAWVEPADGTRLDAQVRLDADAERLTLTLGQPLAPGEARVELRFRGVLNDKLRGFYRSEFTDDDGQARVLATTQMEATHARRAFPCWDEPDFKAVFAITLVVEDGLLAISNAAEVARTPQADDRVAVRFADTMSMSTYLVAFVVGPMEATEAVDVDGTPLRIIHQPNRGHLTPFALDVGAFCLRYFTDWFGIPYPGDKMDLVAIPDFAFGAMENLGCVTFRERLLLVDPDASTKDECQAVVDVIAHELAHMWFGDLVTMRWWNGIWLNEAFATFMEMLATDAYRPDWERWVYFCRERTAAFDTDALGETRPIEFPVESPADAEGMFDVLTYQKGSAVVRMLQQYLGADRFQAGLRRYMDRHRYGNTDTSDLWDALEDETGEPVRRIAESWIFQGGFPHVSVEGSPTQPGTVELAQRPFRYDREGTVDTSRWAVPLVLDVLTANDNQVDRVDQQRVLLDGDGTSLTVDGPVQRVNANAGANGFYRVGYGPALRDRLVADHAQLQPQERYTLVDDTWAAVLSGSEAALTFLELAEDFADETNLYVWELLAAGLSGLDRLVGPDSRERYAARVRALVTPALERLGPAPRPGEDDGTRSLRGVLLEAAAVLGDDAAAQDHSRAVFDRYLADPSGVDASLGSAALAAVATHGDLAVHRRLEQSFRDATTPQERQRLLHAFGAFRDRAALGRTLELTLSETIRSQDAPYVIREALANRDNAETAWSFVTQSWDRINDAFPTNSISRMLSGVRTIPDRTLANQVAKFLDDHPVPQGEKQVSQHLERMWVTVALAERESDRLPAAL